MWIWYWTLPNAGWHSGVEDVDNDIVNRWDDEAYEAEPSNSIWMVPGTVDPND